MAQARRQFGSQCAAINLPIGAEASFSGIASLLGGTVPPELEDAAAAAKDQLAEAVAETDDDLTMKFLDEGELNDADIAEGLHNGARTGQIVPVMAGSAVTGAGIEDLLDAIVKYIPSPDEAADAEAPVDSNGPAERPHLQDDG